MISTSSIALQTAVRDEYLPLLSAVLTAGRIPDNIKGQPLENIRPMELQAFFNAFAETASKSYMDKMRVMVYIKDGKPYVEEHQAKTASSLRTVPPTAAGIPLQRCPWPLAAIYARYRRF